MTIEEIKTQCKKLRIPTVYNVIVEQEAIPESNQLSFIDRIGLIFERELVDRQNKKIDRLIRGAFLKYQPEINTLIYNPDRNLSKDTVLNLISGGYISNKKNIIIVGATGTGKTYLGCAIGMQACRSMHSVKYVRVPRLFADLAIVKDTTEYRKTMDRLKKTEVLILDDFGMSPMSLDETKDFLEIVEDRYQSSSTIILSQLPISDWYQLFKDRTYADAIMDRLFSSSTKIDLKGESLRKE
jgi:DNA replication protein DnaC